MMRNDDEDEDEEDVLGDDDVALSGERRGSSGQLDRRIVRSSAAHETVDQRVR